MASGRNGFQEKFKEFNKKVKGAYGSAWRNAVSVVHDVSNDKQRSFDRLIEGPPSVYVGVGPNIGINTLLTQAQAPFLNGTPIQELTKKWAEIDTHFTQLAEYIDYKDFSVVIKFYRRVAERLYYTACLNFLKQQKDMKLFEVSAEVAKIKANKVTVHQLFAPTGEPREVVLLKHRLEDLHKENEFLAEITASLASKRGRSREKTLSTYKATLKTELHDKIAAYEQGKLKDLASKLGVIQAAELNTETNAEIKNEVHYSPSLLDKSLQEVENEQNQHVVTTNKRSSRRVTEDEPSAETTGFERAAEPQARYEDLLTKAKVSKFLPLTQILAADLTPAAQKIKMEYQTKLTAREGKFAQELKTLTDQLSAIEQKGEESQKQTDLAALLTDIIKAEKSYEAPEDEELKFDQNEDIQSLEPIKSFTAEIKTACDNASAEAKGLEGKADTQIKQLKTQQAILKGFEEDQFISRNNPDDVELKSVKELASIQKDFSSFAKEINQEYEQALAANRAIVNLEEKESAYNQQTADITSLLGTISEAQTKNKNNADTFLSHYKLPQQKLNRVVESITHNLHEILKKEKEFLGEEHREAMQGLVKTHLAALTSLKASITMQQRQLTKSSPVKAKKESGTVPETTDAKKVKRKVPPNLKRFLTGFLISAIVISLALIIVVATNGGALPGFLALLPAAAPWLTSFGGACVWGAAFGFALSMLTAAAIRFLPNGCAPWRKFPEAEAVDLDPMHVRNASAHSNPAPQPPANAHAAPVLPPQQPHQRAIAPVVPVTSTAIVMQATPAPKGLGKGGMPHPIVVPRRPRPSSPVSGSSSGSASPSGSDVSRPTSPDTRTPSPIKSRPRYNHTPATSPDVSPNKPANIASPAVVRPVAKPNPNRQFAETRRPRRPARVAEVGKMSGSRRDVPGLTPVKTN